MERAGRIGIHLVEQLENLGHAGLALGGGLGLRNCHTENITLSRNRLLLLGAGLAAFALSLAGSFHFDDYSLLSGNIWRVMSTRPLTGLTFWLSLAAGDRNPLDYHAIDLALHLIASLLLYDVLQRLVSARAALVTARYR